MKVSKNVVSATNDLEIGCITKLIAFFGHSIRRIEQETKGDMLFINKFERS